MDDTDNAVSKAPLWITPLFQKDDQDDGCYRTVKRLVMRTPNPAYAGTSHGEVETSLEEYLGPSGEILWRRVTVKGYDTDPLLHASFTLPSDESTTCASTENDGYKEVGDHIMCWTSFPERPDHKILCVLASPLLLCIWDVYPSNNGDTADESISGEGHSVTLPFEARGIFPLAEHHGLLLQRRVTMEDRIVDEFVKRSSTWTSRGVMDDEYDGGFVLQDPPNPVRLGLASPSGMEMTITQPSPVASASAEPVPSLFSLRHPLDELRPMTMRGSDSSLSDVNEQVLFTGAPSWIDHNDGPYEKKEYTQPICVTYNGQLKRHAVWLLNIAPPPPPTPPLWQVSRNQRVEDDLGVEIGVITDGNLGRFVVSDPDVSWHGTTNRNEALADALGVGTSRKTDDHVANRVRGRDRSRRSGGLKVPPASVLTPPPIATKDTKAHPVGNESKKRGQFPMDTSGTMADMAATTTPRVFSPFADLSPDFALSILHEEDPDTADKPATNIFLASNVEGSGTLTLCLVCPVKNKLNPCALRWLSLTVTRLQQPSTAVTEIRHTFSVHAQTPLPCVSAQPVKAAPVPLCFVPSNFQRSREEAFATEMLVLVRSNGAQNRMVLYRSGVFLAECALPKMTLSEPTTAHTKNGIAHVTGLQHPVAGHIDFICKDDEGTLSSIRGKLCLGFPSSPISDAVLAASDAAFFFPDGQESSKLAVETALKIRVDCAKLAQAMSSLDDSRSLRTDSTDWSAVDCVLSTYIEVTVSDRDRRSVMLKSHMPEIGESVDVDHWSILRNSDFDATYRIEDSSSLFFGFDGEVDFHTPPGESVMFCQVLTNTIQPTWLKSENSTPLVMSTDASTKPPLLAFRVFDALHLLYEESKLSSCRLWCRKIGSLLVRICFRIGTSSEDNNVTANSMGDFLDHYRRDLGTKWLKDIQACGDIGASYIPNSRDQQMVTAFSRPPCFLEWIDSKMKRFRNHDATLTTSFYDLHDSAEIPPIFRFTRALHRAFSALYREDDVASDQSQRDRVVMQILIEEGIKSPEELRDELPAGLALPLLEVLYRCRSDPQICSISSWSSDAWSLLGRTDMSKQREYRHAQLSYGESSQAFPAHASRYKDLLADTDKDGIQPLEVTSSMLFPDDNRIHEVGKLLRSSRPMYLQVPRAVEVTDHDYERLKQERLLVLCRRAFAVPLGRGMLTFGNLEPVPAEPLPVPALCLSGRVPPTNNTLALDTSSCPADMSVWPEFHNGVAAGLRLPYDENGDGATVHQITRTWIVYNRATNEAPPPQNPANGESTDNTPPTNHAHGGLLMALGLRGHLSTLMMSDIYEYLTQGVVTTTVGILIGMAANRRGSCDPSVSKMLCLHIPSLLPASFTAMDVAGPAQVAAVLSIGLLYQGSSHRLMTEFLLEEMGKRPSNDSITIDREAYTLSCGIALGMVNLAKGNTSSGAFDGSGWNGLADLDLGERLHRFVVGGIDDTEQRRRQEAVDRVTNSFGMPNNDNERSSRIFEGDTINTDITAPGATLALGLMYMKSGNSTVASSLALPDTHFLLEYVRPDMLLLRVLSRALILWDQVHPSGEWIDDQIPTVVKATYSQMRAAAEKGNDITDTSSLGRNGVDMANNGAESGPADGTNGNASSSGIHDEAVDKHAVRQIYVYVVAGACFGIGLRFAGTGDKHAALAVSDRLVELKTMRDGNNRIAAALRPDLTVLEMCLGCVAISLAMVMAGTGDLKTFRLLRMLRWRCDDDIRYGSHMAYGAAIGLLFLGGGSCTLGRSPDDIAALVLAFFPRFPSTTSDNQHHLQALRHCYALAVVKREIRAIDSDTGEIVSVPLEIDFFEPEVKETTVTAPCLLLNMNGTPRTLRVTSDRYYPLTLDIRSPAGITFFVKKRSGHLTHSQDPHSQRSLVVPTGSGSHGVRDLIESFTENPILVAYAQYLCDSGPRTLSWVSDFCGRLLHECLLNDTEEALPLCLKLRSSVEAMRDECPTFSFWDIRLIRTYYEEHPNVVAATRSPRLLSAEFVCILNEIVEQTLAATPFDENDVLVYMKSGERRTASKEASRDLFAAFLTWFDVPFPKL